MYVLAMEVELRIALARSLKDKRQVVKGLLEAPKRRFGVSAAEVGAQDSWQRAVLGYAVVASSVRGAEDVLDSVESFIWSHPEVDVVTAERTWLEPD